MSGLIDRLDIGSDGRIKQTKANLNTLASIKKRIKDLILTDAYLGRVSSFNLNFGRLLGFDDSFFDSMLDSFSANDALADVIKTDAIELTVESLTASGLDVAIVDPLQKALTDAVTTGQSVFDIREQLREIILGDKERLGHLERHVGQIARDSLNQTNRAYTQSVAEGLGLEWYFYSKGTVAASREFCLQRNGHYFHKKEIEKWPSLQWKGKIPGTNSSNIFILLAGWNCMHSLTPVSKSIVPESAIKRAERLGFA